MKKLVTALSLSLFAAAASAAEEPMNILYLGVLPLVVEDVGPVITARVDSWGKTGSDTGQFTKVNQRMVDALHARGCKMTMHVQGQMRIQLSDPKAVLTCESGPGAKAQIELKGALLDREFTRGLSAVGADDSVLFIVEEGGKKI
ncbi:hypothetical protein AXW87_07300 [Pseudomonas aeruginosa]|uniref:Uncharacterized protein n=1 Tax=Pseudomonas citronellolis TaxID=53408 RepID=A0A1A9KML8_9PSED|nr:MULTISPECIES: hypothetical protein [Pseudomonas aeruginosa group]ANI18772.1 hypothetical protein A9C11_32450 [Pseudomonas citronellolis]RIY51545.1 hypothetical protein AXW87_07300 [Pseudomonas aeruginosa]RIY56917.1 hypothetical protein AXW88_07305 [Pseudomonas aeruginosa]HBO6867525.1 hypothetical protein [Pseudomonas aeruginosa]HBO6920534.1 hypothetical protein [Pseudomonas aeruginosa]